MSLLVSFEEQNDIKPMSINNKAKYEQIASEVESLELDKLLGYAFYQAVSATPTNYTNLLDGCSFEDYHGNTVTHKGLRYVLKYLNYAKYIGEANVFDTYTGMVQKTRQDSESLSVGQIKNLQQESREIAFNAFALIRIYLNKNSTTYPLWNCQSDKKISKPVFYGVKNTLR
jgi:hypothetical protein